MAQDQSKPVNPACLFKAKTLIIPGTDPNAYQVLHDVTLSEGHRVAMRNLAKAKPVVRKKSK